MRKIAFLLLAIMIIALGCTKKQAQRIEQLEEENAALKAITAPPPSSLDALNPPEAQEPEYMMKMLEMSTPFVGILTDFFENDFQNVKANFEKFEALYVEVSKLVPEWEKDFPSGPVEELGKALESGDQEKVKEAYEKLSKVCFDCHVANIIKVQQKYHWKDFDGIMTKDPLTNEEVDFIQLMQYLDSNFVGIIVDVEQGQMENAQKQLQGFKARFQAMKDTCRDCHGKEEKKYYIDESIQALIDGLEQAISGSSIDPKTVEKLFMGIGMESCINCNFVHMPAAMAKHQWKK